MKTAWTLALVGLFCAALTVPLTLADENEAVELSDLHLCCGGCVSALTDALDEVKGVSDVTVDQKGKSAKFHVDDEKTIASAMNALAKAGMYGTVTLKGEKVPVTVEGTGTGKKANLVVLKDVHLCCGSCAKSVAKAFEGVKSVSTVDCDVKGKIVSLTGTEIDLDAVYEALHHAGFHGTLVE